MPQSFLSLFERKYQGMIVNAFLEPIRRGVRSHDEIIIAVDIDIQKRKELAYRWRYELKPYWTILEENLSHPDIHDFIDYYIQYTDLPYEQKQKIKQKKAQQSINYWMSEQPATEKQIAYCKSLGWQ